MSEEPRPTSKYVFQDFNNIETLWFDTAEEVAEHLTEKTLIDPEEYACYEIGKEVKFKVVPA